ncbi:MAG: hypothetical protein WBL63_21410 [Candidatus Acidiferrum sp.]
MPVIAKLPGYSWLGFLKDVAVRTGIYAGLSLSFIFVAWVLIANRAPLLERFALERNIAASALLIFFASVPLMRFYRSPAELLISGLLAWGLLTLTYRILCLVFVLLEQRYSAFQIFVLGAVSYLVLATVSWIGTIIWRVRATDSSHTHR